MTLGTRVQVPAWSDAWMKGDRYGEVAGFGRGDIVKIKMDKSGKTLRFAQSDVTLCE